MEVHRRDIRMGITECESNLPHLGVPLWAC